MTLAIVYSRGCFGIDAPLVNVETHLSRGMPRLAIVGLPETAVKESKDRVRSAILNTHFEFPMRRITINLAPADLPKEGGRFDLPIALGILAASHQLPQDKLLEYEFAGELALSGELRPIHGALPLALGSRQAKRCLVLPEQNAAEASLVKEVTVYAAKHILEICAHLTGKKRLLPYVANPVSAPTYHALDLADVCGQAHAKRALEIAAAGRHSMLLMGPPGTGKSMLAARLTSILPKLSDEQALEVAAIASISNTGFDVQQWLKCPYRSPHHSASSVALVGGGRPPKPGEISLAHQGVLFLDELPEFNRHVLDSLREPLEAGQITISRAACQALFPARFQLIAAMNPCPCGHFGNPQGNCRCTSEQVQRYLAKLSGPLLDRIDMHVEVPALPHGALSGDFGRSESSASVRQRVENAREQQLLRMGKINADLAPADLEQVCKLGPQEQQLLTNAMQKWHFSARVYHRILKIARTIADLEYTDQITVSHLSEALSYRCLDRVRPVA